MKIILISYCPPKTSNKVWVAKNNQNSITQKINKSWWSGVILSGGMHACSWYEHARVLNYIHHRKNSHLDGPNSYQHTGFFNGRNHTHHNPSTETTPITTHLSYLATSIMQNHNQVLQLESSRQSQYNIGPHIGPPHSPALPWASQ